MPELDDLRQLVQNPRETLGTELKAWIDPTTPEGIAKFARAAIALWNNNGGCLLVGFNDDGTPSPNPPANVRDIYHVDGIQAIVARYAAHPIAIDVQFVTRDGVDYPVMLVAPGVVTPVAAKSDLVDSGRPLIKYGTVYVRTLNSNNTVSTSEARVGDWDRITKLCFENREADIGAFVRRHLSSIDLGQLSGILQSIASANTSVPVAAPASSPTPATPSAPTPVPVASPVRTPPVELATQLLDYGRGRLTAETARRRVSLPQSGTFEAAVVIDGEVPQQSFSNQWLFQLRNATPHHSGWPLWAVIPGTGGLEPHVMQDGYEALMIKGDWDFWRIDPLGRFYCCRSFWDDVGEFRRPPQPGTLLDPSYQIGWVTEVLAYCSSFARLMRCSEQGTALQCAFRWTGVAGRRLAEWSSPNYFFPRGDISHENEKTTTVRLPLETPASAIAPYVEQAVRPLFGMFGESMPSERIAAIVSRVLAIRA